MVLEVFLHLSDIDNMQVSKHKKHMWQTKKYFDLFHPLWHRWSLLKWRRSITTTTQRSHGNENIALCTWTIDYNKSTHTNRVISCALAAAAALARFSSLIALFALNEIIIQIVRGVWWTLWGSLASSLLSLLTYIRSDPPTTATGVFFISIFTSFHPHHIISAAHIWETTCRRRVASVTSYSLALVCWALTVLRGRMVRCAVPYLACVCVWLCTCVLAAVEAWYGGGRG